MDRIGNEELWLFKKEIRHECDIWNSSIPEPVKQALAEQWRNRMILETGRDDTGKPLYCPVWTYKKTTAWNSLSNQERDSLEQLFAQKSRTNELRWKEQAVELLGTLTSSTEMLACAEDLGTIPESVPEVLDTFNILGLKVIRWERKWTEPGQPFKDICAYPVKSVATTSVHDSSTIRGWWEQENGGNDFTRDYGSILDGLPEDTQQAAKNSFSVELAKRVLEKLSETSSALFVVPLQDFLYLDQTFYAENPDDERINVPGSVSTFNWTYRLPVTCEELIKNKNLIASIRSVLSARRTQPKCL
jgi:4-alpha-glucanotransferase